MGVSLYLPLSTLKACFHLWNLKEKSIEEKMPVCVDALSESLTSLTFQY